MSPSNVMIEGEVRGPDYGRTAFEPLRNSPQGLGVQEVVPVYNGVVSSPVDGELTETTNPPLVPGSAATVTVQEVAPRQLPQHGGTVEASPSGVRDDTGLGARTNVFAGTVRDETVVSEAGLFPQFTPSPLPGQSPVAAQGTTTRAAAWLSRLGDYLQKTVEAYAGQPAVAHAAMGDLNQQLRRERERTDDAMRELPQVIPHRSLDSKVLFVSVTVYLTVMILSKGNLLTTMARGIEALLRQQEQMGPKADRPETVKPGITDLPRLPEYQPMTGSIDLLNWLTHIQPIMEDLSDTSYAWWEGTLQDAAAWYTSYSAASPLERLRLKPLSSEGLHRPEWARVERRATAMMLSAVPPQVREEVIAMGNVSSLALLCKLYAVYQPGNLQEKSLVLQKLERPDECDTALQAVEALRKWTLWRRRASSIGIAEPDASVLIQGLDRITTKVVKANSELSFRVSLIRSTLQVDVCPSLQSVTSFHQHLQAEMEQQARLSVTQGPGGHAQRKVEFAEGEGEIRAKVLQVLSEVQHLPMVKSLMDKIREWMSTASPSSASRRLALLDSGATHVLRAPTTSAEWELAREVKVQLAGDSVMAMKQNEAGSLLTGDQLAQVIVPLGKVIQDLGYRLLWTSEVCELVGPQGDVLPLTIRNGCPEVSEKVAYRLIQQLEAQQLPELEGVTQASISAIAKLKSSWWSYLKEYVKTGDVTEAHRAVDKAPFFDYKDVIKEQMITRTPREGIWNLMKGLRVNRRARKRLLRASSWIVRWDVPAIDKAVDPMKHLMFVGDMVYVNLNTMLIENEFADLWKVVQWAAFNGRIGVVVANDGPARPLEQVVARPHRSKVHFLHALATAAREVHGGEVVRLYIEDLERVHKVSSGAEDPAMAVWPPWTLCKESRSYYEEMGLSDVSIGRTADTGAWRIAKLSGDAAWRLHVARNHQPFRRDCSVCVRNSAAGHQHRATAHPMAYTLSVDVVGPLKGFGRSPDGKFFKYFVIGAMRIPKV
ncbi:GIP, partial [Symbiodinium microadriaticum]